MLGLHSHIKREVSIAPLATFRALFGMIMIVSILRFAMNGWIEQLYIEPQYFFSFSAFDWVRPFSKYGMYALFVLMAIGAAGIMAGWRYRIASPLFFFTFTYVELIDKTNYLNHYYFVSIIAFLLMLVPANRYFSLDVIRKPEIELTKVPGGMVNIFKLQLGLVYFFAGMAKINPDWLIKAMPLKIWLAGKTNIPLIGSLLNYKWVAYVFSWGGMLYDLCVPFLLISSRWRKFGYLGVLVFHILTSLLFKIGMFPFIMILCTLIFFPASFHQNLITRFRSVFQPVASAIILRQQVAVVKRSGNYTWRIIPIVIAIHFAIQIVIPLRYVIYPGDLFWTEEGYRFSWRVMLMEKAGSAQFQIRSANGKTEHVDNSEFLTPYQEKMMSTQPDMILQFAHHLASIYSTRGFESPSVYVNAQVTLNGRRSRPIIDNSIDLASVRYSPGDNYWITKQAG